MVENLHWLGHASFRFDGSKTVYFDPWKLSLNPKKADIVLITHDHFDHYSPDDIELIATGDTTLLADRIVSKQLQNAKPNCKEIKSLSPQDTANIQNVKIMAVASYNTNKQFHTKEANKLGFIVTLDGLTIYHAGDTDFIPEMKDYRCDIALLPVSGTYVMTAEEAAHAALAIKPKIAIPMHYGDIVGSTVDARRFHDLLKGKIEVRILKKED
jgi:L-ascorbate metabolism protein UlaG (beta-lactamase superfamily)